MQNDRICIVCGKAYQYCNHCGDKVKREESWRTIYHDENCKKIFEVLSKHAFGHITDQEAKKELQNLDLSKKDDFRADLKKQVNQILSTPNVAQNQNNQGQPQKAQAPVNNSNKAEFVNKEFKK